MQCPFLASPQIVSGHVQGCVGCLGFTMNIFYIQLSLVAFYAKPVESWLIVSNVSVTATMFPVGGVS